MKTEIKNFLYKQNIHINKINNYENAFLHSSFTHETPEDDISYERLEFLGDSILGMIMAEYLFNNFSQFDQGEMSLIKHKYVGKKFLSKVGKKLKLEEIISVGLGEDKNNLSNSIYEDVIESLIGAIYLDSGYEEAKKFVYKNIISEIPSENINPDELKDPKTRLQENLQAESKNSVVYETDKRPNDLGYFSSKVKFDKKILGNGKGMSKKEAEKNAAKNALEKIANGGNN